MISTRVKPTRRTPPPYRRNDGAHKVFHDPASVSTALRELAVSAHRAVQDSQILRSKPGAPADRVAAADRELSELYVRILQLQRSVDAQSLSGLAPYVEALRRKVLLVLGP
jgi:hypothetical protein